jgi:hypothetical protein
MILRTDDFYDVVHRSSVTQIVHGTWRAKFSNIKGIDGAGSRGRTRDHLITNQVLAIAP